MNDYFMKLNEAILNGSNVINQQTHGDVELMEEADTLVSSHTA